VVILVEDPLGAGPGQDQRAGRKAYQGHDLATPSGNSKDAQIDNDALPILINETVTAQSATIDMVSGATVTSAGYVQSLQAALDQAGSG
jgi:major membrane immunogen (membrane-anchored lipoprotein)